MNLGSKIWGAVYKRRAVYNYYFDPLFYVSQDRRILTDSHSKKIGLVEHYIRHGWREGLNPSRYFSTSWYLSQVSADELGGLEPLVHYINFGWRQGYAPHPYFDVRWYMMTYVDVRDANVEPLRHFLLYGQYEGRRCHPYLSSEYFLKNVPATLGLSIEDVPKSVAEYDLSTSPKISIIITNHNGMQHLPDLFDSLDAQTYERFEILFVDDASTDGSLEYARKRGAKVIASPKRLGFAEANNQGLAAATGELIALFNNDMRLDSNCLESLVRSIQRDSQIGAVAAHMRFWTKFRRIVLTSSNQFFISTEEFDTGLVYSKHFMRVGEATPGRLLASRDHNSGRYRLEVDIPEVAESFVLGAQSAASVSIRFAGSSMMQNITVQSDTHFFLKNLHSSESDKFYIINNAGSDESEDLSPFDRGIGEIDIKQYQASYMKYFCGGAVIIRHDALLGADIFLGDMKAYFEDSELSLRLRRSGFLISYEPSAIVYHRHSASHKEHSFFWRRQTFRNKIIFQYIYGDKNSRDDKFTKELSHIDHLFSWSRNQTDLVGAERQFFDDLPQVKAELIGFCGRIKDGTLSFKSQPRIGIYNSFWNTRGGGEAHALSIAQALNDFGMVELISEQDFSIQELADFFGINIERMRKRIVKRMTPELSAEYDVFVNSTFQNEMPSMAKHSYYVVSFPSRTPSPAFLDSYKFLFNSHYTKSWALRMWGVEDLNQQVLFPAVKDEFFANDDDLSKKKKYILSVGRFASEGHTKNQLEIVEAFRAFKSSHPRISQEWGLILIGSVNDVAYLERVVANAADDASVMIKTDCSFSEVIDFYKHSSIYVHASGYGKDEESEPELQEHFGMAVAQAVAAGCFPITFDSAGPKEILELIGSGSRFNTVDELVEQLAKGASWHSENSAKSDRSTMVDRARMFSEEALRSAVFLALQSGPD